MAVSDEIKDRLDIVEVVTSYVPNLQKAGRNYKATCPFHSERTPSFVVFPERQSWRCFGACATGGDVLSFVMRMEKLSFSDTLKLLAQRTGVTIAPRREQQAQNILYQINEAAAAFFQQLLASPQGVAARAYLQQRKVDSDTIKRFQIGLSPGSGSRLLDYLRSRGYSQEQILHAGLATTATDAPRDLFHSRLMFPIHNADGKMAGFGGRSLDGTEPKYLNSPRTDAFDKGNILYGLNLAKNTIKEQGEVVVVEGYMDAIAAHQSGFTNVVASMGTSLTENQVALIQGTGRKFVLALDPDSAGQEATFRDLVQSWHIFERRRVGQPSSAAMYERITDLSSIRVALLPDGKDPDEVIHNDPSKWQKLIADALPLVEYLFSTLPERWDITTSEGKATAAQALYPLITATQNSFEQDRYLQRLAKALGTNPATLEASLGRPSQAPSRRTTRSAAKPQASKTPFEREIHDPLEEHFLGLLLRWPELCHEATNLDPQTLDRWDSRHLFTILIERSTIEEPLKEAEENLRQYANYLLSLSIPDMGPHIREQAIKDCVRRLEERRLRRLKVEEALLLEQEGLTEESQEIIVETNEKLRKIFSQQAAGYNRGQ